MVLFLVFSAKRREAVGTRGADTRLPRALPRPEPRP